MRSPFQIDGPAVASFSGGRTSAFMLHRLLEADLLIVAPETQVIFCNTGKEHEKTLEFVRDCAERWGVEVVWLEYYRTRFPKFKNAKNAARQMAVCAAAGRSYGEPGDEPGFRRVTFETASRQGEPFENLIDLSGLPNFATPFCSTELKTRVVKKYMRSLGYEHWDNLVGVRADEAHRLAKMRANAGKESWEVEAPLVAAGARVRDVFDFWLGPLWMPGQPIPCELPQGFDLGLQPEWGNCDGCFKKQAEKLVRIFAAKPRLSEWWQAQQDRTGSVWNLNVSLVHIRRAAERGVLPGLFERDDPSVCGCTD